jgi:hypothetical protein
MTDLLLIFFLCGQPCLDALSAVNVIKLFSSFINVASQEARVFVPYVHFLTQSSIQERTLD